MVDFFMLDHPIFLLVGLKSYQHYTLPRSTQISDAGRNTEGTRPRQGEQVFLVGDIISKVPQYLEPW